MSTSQSEKDLLRGALIPSLVVGVLAIIIAALVRGSAGLVGALVAQLVVVIYFAVHLGVARISRNLDPGSTFALALFSYFAKFLLLGIFLLILTRTTSRESIDRGAFALTAITLTLIWQASQIRAFLKLRLHLPLPPTKG